MIPAPGSTLVPRERLAELFAHFQAGRLAEMESLAAELARQHPSDGQAWKAWGVALMAQHKDALATLRRAMALLPADADIPSNLGGILVAHGELAEAADCYRRALRLRPGFAAAHSNLGDVLVRLEQWQAAETSCRQAVRLQPGLGAAHLNLGNALKGAQRLDEAVASYRQALVCSPTLAQAHAALGIALKEQGLHQSAVASLRQSLALRPDDAATLDQLGVVLHVLGDHEAARTCMTRALTLQPQLAAVHYHLGNLLADLGRLDEAVQSHRLALTLAPGHAEVHANLGVCLLALNRVDEAVDALREAAALQPAEALVHGNLGNALMAQGHMAQARASLEQAVALRPDLVLARSNLAHLLKTIGEPEGALAQLEAALGLEPEQLALRSEVLFMRQYLPHPLSHPLSTLAIARGFGELAAQRARRFTDWRVSAQPERALRIGLVSGDLRSHPVGYFLESVLAALSTAAADRVAIHAYANQRHTDDVSLRLKQTCAAWLEVADLDDAALAQRIHSDGIDVLVDLSGHTRNNRLAMLAWKPAPVQVSWLGYCGTTGVDLVDAFLADPWIAPAGIEPDYVEPIVRLPESFLCFTPPAAPMIVGPLPALSARAVHFGCFNHLAKMNDAVVAAWAKILSAVPGSRLLLQSLALHDPAIQRSVAERFGRYGISAARLGLQPAQSRDDYLAAYRQVDIALDPFPYPGGTTTLEALWMGVPVLTLPGDTALSRQGLSILQNLGLADWVASNADDYVARAVRHSADLPALARLRAGLRQRLLDSPLCDAVRFAGYFEQALRGVWRDWCGRQGMRPP